MTANGSMKSQLSLILLFFCSCSLQIGVMSLPYMVLSSRSQKCLGVSPPRNTEVTINYHFPDVVVMAQDAEDDLEEKADDPNARKDDLSKRYKERYDRKMEEMKKTGRKLNDVSITMYQRFEHVPGRKAGDDRGTVRTRTEVHEKHGTMTFVSAPNEDGVVEICAHSMQATPERPYRFQLNVTMAPNNVKQIKVNAVDPKVKGTVSSLSRDLQGMDNKIAMINNMATQAKQQEIEFHDQSVSMGRASRMWPIVHIVVLFISGFIQARHVSRFFTKHRIVY